MKNQGIRIVVCTKQIIYSLMIVGFVLLTSCIVKNSLLSAISAQSHTEKSTTYVAYSVSSSADKCAISEAANRGAQKDSLKLTLFLADVVISAAIFVKSLDYHQVQKVFNPFKKAGLPLIWLMTCTLRL
ncbi:hypothetical protein [Sphingobacterium kitahiroshimense]|uniref:Lipoprotein n=1 Tax=Sphingobacterium kitahiroshimense TaxID=470446 RepID=A0ABV0BY97_9SPHI